MPSGPRRVGQNTGGSSGLIVTLVFAHARCSSLSIGPPLPFSLFTLGGREGVLDDLLGVLPRDTVHREMRERFALAALGPLVEFHLSYLNGHPLLRSIYQRNV